jgi:hypothetical protein
MEGCGGVDVTSVSNGGRKAASRTGRFDPVVVGVDERKKSWEFKINTRKKLFLVKCQSSVNTYRNTWQQVDRGIIYIYI